MRHEMNDIILIYIHLGVKINKRCAVCTPREGWQTCRSMMKPLGAERSHVCELHVYI